MTQEDKVELARQETPDYARVATLEIVVDCILFRRESYSLRLRSTGPSAVVDPVEDPCEAGGDDRISKDSVLSSIHADEEDEAGEA